MIKKFTRFQIAALKRTMKNIAPLLRRRATLEKKANELLAELKQIDEQIAAYKQIVEPITGGIDPELIIAQGGIVEIQEGDEIPTNEEVEVSTPEEAADGMPNFQ